MGKIKRYFQKKEKDKFGKEYAMLIGSLMSNLKETEKLLAETDVAFEDWRETLKDLNEIATAAADLVDRYREALNVASEPQD